MTVVQNKNRIAIWAITSRGAALGRQIADALPDAVLHLSEKLGLPADRTFDRLSDAINTGFHDVAGHIFIMSTGIVVRRIAPLIRHKTTDPAVVVLDEKAIHAISLLSGHIGGANRLTHTVAGITGADPVITTATDVNGLPAIDTLARTAGLAIENPSAIKHVNTAILEGKPIYLHDPFARLEPAADAREKIHRHPWPAPTAASGTAAGVFVDDRKAPVSETTLVLRPATLTVGMGCNRGTNRAEMMDLLIETLARHSLSIHSIARIGSVDIKRDETGLIRLAAELDRPLIFFTRDQLRQVESIETPSTMVEKHIGVKSVCEAAAILASNGGRLIVPKQKTPNVTLALARESCTS